MFNLVKSVASEAPTLSPLFNNKWSFKISTAPLLIFDGIFNACKKEVWVGSSPVLPAGTTTSTGEIEPRRAGASTLKPIT